MLDDLTKQDSTNLPSEPLAELANRFAVFFKEKAETIRKNVEERSQNLLVQSSVTDSDSDRPVTVDSVLLNLGHWTERSQYDFLEPLTTKNVGWTPALPAS